MDCVKYTCGMKMKCQSYTKENERSRYIKEKVVVYLPIYCPHLNYTKPVGKQQSSP